MAHREENIMRRRDFLLTTGAAALGLSAFPLRFARAASGKKRKILYFTRSAGFQHSAVKRTGDELSFSEKTLTEMGQRAAFDVVCTKDGAVFDEPLDAYDALAFYTSGDLTKPDDPKRPVNPAGSKPMSPDGKKRLLDAIAAGMGYVGFHSANDSFHSPGERDATQTELDPYIAMVGGEFIIHGKQQEAAVRIASPKFPGLVGLASPLKFTEEWYALKNFAKDLHVILVQETQGMEGDCYQRAPYPGTWARMHGKGRVYYTSFGHREDIWTNPTVQQIILGGIAWATGDAEADVSPNLEQTVPGANQIPKLPPRKPKPPKAAKPAGKKPSRNTEPALGQQVHLQHQHRDELLAGRGDQPAGMHRAAIRRAGRPGGGRATDRAGPLRRRRLGAAPQFRPLARHRSDQQVEPRHLGRRRGLAEPARVGALPVRAG